ncbi:MAG: DNA-methyltransferase [Candidatus Limnocylindria bacterium]
MTAALSGRVGRADASVRTPLFETADVTLYRGDAIAVLRGLPTASVDACLTDPPYGERIASWDGPRGREWYVAWLRQVNRVLVPDGPILTFAPRRRLDVIMTALREVRGDEAFCPLQTMAWVHRQGFRPAAGFLRPEHEAIVLSGLVRPEADEVRAARQSLERRKVTCPACGAVGEQLPNSSHPVGLVAGTVFGAPRNKRREATGHPTQKPEAVVRYLVALISEPGDTILDPFAGSGTTLVAARAIGRRAIGIDRSRRACGIASRRCDREDRP